MIETPEVYIFGRIHGSTLITVYSQTRMEDIEELKKPLEIDNGVEIYDIMRLFKGDGPSCQVEAGQQKGGHYFCWICGIHCISSHDFAHAAYRKWLSFEDRQKKVLSSHRSIEKSKEKFVDLYSNLKKGELIDELDERGIKYSSIDNVADLKNKLVTAMQGIKRVPSLLYNCPEKDVYYSELKYYEIMACEPLHERTHR